MVDFIGSQQDAVIGLYIAFFDRAPESDGLDYHMNALSVDLAQGLSLTEALVKRAENFYSAAVELGVYTEDMSGEAFVRVLYDNLLQRPGVGGDAPTDDEVTYWVNRLDEGSVGTVAASMMKDVSELTESGTPDEQEVAQLVGAVLENRVEVATVFAQSEYSGELSGEEAIAAGRAALEGVDETEESVQQAISEVKGEPEEEDSGSGGGGPSYNYVTGDDSPNTLALTASSSRSDIVDAKADNDTIDGSLVNSLESGDSIDGGAGTDELNATLDGTAPAPTLAGVETVVLTNLEDAIDEGAGAQDAFGLDMTNATGLSALWAVNADTEDPITGDDKAVFTVSNATLGVTYGARNFADNGTYAINFASDVSGTSDQLSLAVDDVDADAVDFQFAGIETVNVAANGDAGATADVVTLNAGADLVTLNVTGTGDLDIDPNASDLSTYDASGASGAVTANLSDSTVSLTATGGSGVDTIMAGSGADTLNGGDGGDTINTSAGADVVTGGGGNDTINLGSGSETVVFEATAGDNGADTVTAFADGSSGDILNFTAFLAGAADFRGEIAAGTIGAADGGYIAAAGENVFVVAQDGAAAGDFDDDTNGDISLAELQASSLAIGNDANAVLLYDDGTDVDAYYVETDATGNYSSIQLVGTMTVTDSGDYVDGNFA